MAHEDKSWWVIFAGPRDWSLLGITAAVFATVFAVLLLFLLASFDLFPLWALLTAIVIVVLIGIAAYGVYNWRSEQQTESHLKHSHLSPEQEVEQVREAARRKRGQRPR